MSETLRNCVAWAQHVKQLIMLTAGIETKKQKDMNKGELQMFMATEYSNWLEILEQKYPQARVHNWLEYTTGTRTTKVSGDYLYRNFSQGLREFHKANPIWNRTLAEGVSGKSKEEVWARFCYNLLCHRMGNVPEDKIPSSFDYERFEKGKWMFAYKWMGPPCEFLELGERQSHEFLATPTELSKRGTGSKKRAEDKLSRKYSREKHRKATKESKARATKAAEAKASASKNLVALADLGRTQTVQNQLKLDSKERSQRFAMLKTMLEISEDPAEKQRWRQEMGAIAMSTSTFAETDDRMYNRDVVDLAQSSEDDEGEDSSASAGPIVISDDEDTTDVSGVIKDVVHQSGYVIIPELFMQPEIYVGENWWTNLCMDLKILEGTNNYVPIFNQPGKTNDGLRSMLLFSDFKVAKRFPPNPAKTASPPEVMERVQNFLKPWFAKMLHKLHKLKLAEPPRCAREPLLLVSKPGCQKQRWHWDFNPAKVQALMAASKYEGVPLSCLCSFTPGGSALDLQNNDGTVKHIRIPFGSMIIFTGDIIHCGSQYNDYNVRGFYHVHHQTLCPFSEDTVYMQQQPSVTASDTSSAAAHDDTSNATPPVAAKKPKKRLGARMVRKSNRLAKADVADTESSKRRKHM